MGDVGEGEGLKFLAAVPGHLTKSLIHLEETVGVKVHPRRPHRGGVKESAEALLALAQGDFSGLAASNFIKCSQEANGPILGVEEEPAVGTEPVNRPIGPESSILTLVAALPVSRLLEQREDPWKVVRMHAALPVFGGGFAFAGFIAEQREHG